jgi:hypothetical protein
MGDAPDSSTRAGARKIVTEHRPIEAGFGLVEECIYMLMSFIQTMFCALKITNISTAENTVVIFVKDTELREIGRLETACLLGCPQFSFPDLSFGFLDIIKCTSSGSEAGYESP